MSSTIFSISYFCICNSIYVIFFVFLQYYILNTSKYFKCYLGIYFIVLSRDVGETSTTADTRWKISSCWTWFKPVYLIKPFHLDSSLEQVCSLIISFFYVFDFDIEFDFQFYINMNLYFMFVFLNKYYLNIIVY